MAIVMTHWQNHGHTPSLYTRLSFADSASARGGMTPRSNLLTWSGRRVARKHVHYGTIRYIESRARTGAQPHLGLEASPKACRTR